MVIGCGPPVIKERYALVIGNAKYEHSGLDELDHVINDASDIKTALENIGFKVTHKENIATKQKIMSEVNTFTAGLKGKSNIIVLFYYGGHGVNVNKESYIIPTNFSKLDKIKKYTKNLVHVKTDILHNIKKNSSGHNIFILDACRNQSLSKQNQSQNDIKSKLAIGGIDPPPRSVLIYSAEPYKVAHALDGELNSLFAKHLIAELNKPSHLPIGKIALKIGDTVTKEANEKNISPQRPWITGTSETLSTVCLSLFACHKVLTEDEIWALQPGSS